MADALATAEGAALAAEIVDMLESELVRFQHRVAHDHGIELDRARAAMVLLGSLLGAGATWTAKPDCDPIKIYKVFESLLPKEPAIAPTLKKELAAFFIATSGVKVVETTSETPAAALRAAGATPSLWWWAADFSTRRQCWAACADDIDQSIQVALAFGVPVEPVAAALAQALASLASRVKTRHSAQRPTLLAALEHLDDHTAITRLAFEMRFKDPKGTDPLAELSIHAFQLAEALQATTDTPDVERFGAIARRAEKMFTSRGLQFVAMVRAEIEDAVSAVL